jgi:hypothetical protein
MGYQKPLFTFRDPIWSIRAYKVSVALLFLFRLYVPSERKLAAYNRPTGSLNHIPDRFWHSTTFGLSVMARFTYESHSLHSFG